MRKNVIFIFVFFIWIQLSAQLDSIGLNDSAYLIGKGIVSGFQQGSSKKTSLNMEAYTLKQMNERAPFNLSDALAKLPGISQMTTGNSISKPVIRGLYGNRILVLLSGLRFDNQQWQDEHGLGLSQIGIERVEIIRGPASLLYGSDAIGGVINIIEEKPIKNGKKTDAGMQLYSNTLGALADIGFSNKTDKHWWRLRLGLENHADYSDGKNNRVLNSRNRGYYLKTGFGFDRKKWKQENSCNFSYNEYGFIMDDLRSSFTGDGRWVRSMNGPHHIVMLSLLNSQNTIPLKKSLLKLNAGFQSNLRREDEGGGQISLSMHLMSFLQNAKWEKSLNQHTVIVVNQQLSLTNNTNYGGRIIIPDATMIESNLTAYLKFQKNKWIIEAGAGINDKNIKTFLTRSLNNYNQPILSYAKPVLPFVKNNLTANGMIGFVFQPKKWLIVKQNNATGFRAPNLAELSSNGVHEGVYRYEIGNRDLKTEQNFNSDLSFEIDKKQLFMSFSVYHNYFNNYIYLTPTAAHDSFYTFPVYLYQQQNARIVGGEYFLIYKPEKLKGLQLKETVSVTSGKLQKGGYLPFIPAYKTISAVRWETYNSNKTKNFFIEPEFVYVFSQDKPALFETSTLAYYLINASAGVNILQPGNSKSLRISLNINNMTNTNYFDHLSRLKYYGLNNQGRNIALAIRQQF